MPDISLCINEKCTIKKNCYRHTAKPSEIWQSVIHFEQNKDKTCDHFIDNKNKK